MLRAVVDDILSQSGSHARDVCKEPDRGVVCLDTYGVDTTFDSEVESLTQAGLVDVVLILPHPDAFGINLDQFGKRVHETATDGYGTTHGDVVVGKFASGDVGGRVDGRPVFVDGKDLQFAVETDGADKVFGLAPGSAVAYGDGFDLVLLDECAQAAYGAVAFGARRMGVDGVVVQQ